MIVWAASPVPPTLATARQLSGQAERIAHANSGPRAEGFVCWMHADWILAKATLGLQLHHPYARRGSCVWLCGTTDYRVDNNSECLYVYVGRTGKTINVPWRASV